MVEPIGLNPAYIYLLECDRVKVSAAQADEVVAALRKEGVRVVTVRTHNGDGIRVVGPEPEDPRD